MKSVVNLWIVVGIFKNFLEIRCVHFLAEHDYIPTLQVTTDLGVIQGRELQPERSGGGPIFAYRGIPYAQPPLRNLRFRSPKPLTEKWMGVLNATEDGHQCVHFHVLTFPPALMGDEDCLLLNIFTQQNPSSLKELLPVMVFFHGGGFFCGDTNSSFYNPEHFLKENVIVVTLNYRLGAFGFLSTGDMASPGNYGLKDQNMALQWLQKNLKYFGGNPKRVTIFGHSAGSVSTHYHVVSPKSKGLFQQAILQSGTVFSQWGLQTKPDNAAFLIGALLRISFKNSFDLIKKLRKVNINDLRMADVAALLFIANILQNGLSYAPTIEPEHPDAFISRPNMELLQKGEYNKVPIMMGVTRNESTLFSYIVQLVKPAIALFDTMPRLYTPPALRNFTTFEEATEIGNKIKKFYFNGKSITKHYHQMHSFFDDDNFVRPSRKAALLMAKHNPVYFYVFNYYGNLADHVLPYGETKTFIEGVGHSEELFYMWQLKGKQPLTADDDIISQRMIKLWTNFAKYGNPTPTPEKILENIRWPVLNENGKKWQHLEIDKRLSIKEKLKEKEMTFWDQLFEKYERNEMYLY